MSYSQSETIVATILRKMLARHASEVATLLQQTQAELNKLPLPGMCSPNDLLNELVHFLYIKAHDKDVSPPYLIDKVWRLVLSMPKLYISLCGYIGRDGNDGNFNIEHMIDHDPVGGAGNDARPRQVRHERTLSKYRDFFPQNSVTFSIIWNEDMLNRLVGINNAVSVEAVAVPVDERGAAQHMEETAAVPSSSRFRIYVQKPNNEEIELKCNSCSTVATIKRFIQARDEIPVHKQRLTFMRRPLDNDNKTLEECGIHTGSTLRLEVLSPHRSDDITITVCLVDESNVAISVSKKTKVAEFKRLVTAKTGLMSDPVVFNGVELINSHSLEDYGLVSGSKVNVGNMQIFLKNLKGKTLTILIHPNDTVIKLKELILGWDGIPICQQRLRYSRYSLDDNDKTFADYRVRCEAIIHLVLSLTGC